MEGTQPASTIALLRAAHQDQQEPAAIPSGPRLVRRRSAVAVVAVLIPLALLLGASAAELRARASTAPARRFAATSATTPAPTPVPTRDLGTCASDYTSLFTAIAPLPGDIAAQVVAQLSPDYADAIGRLAMSISPDALPPPPDAPTLAHVLARLSAPERRAVLSALPPEQQDAVNRELLDTALLFMTYGIRPPCP